MPLREELGKLWNYPLYSLYNTAVTDLAVMGGDLDYIGQLLHCVLLVTADTDKGAPSKLICQLLHQQQKHTVHLFATVKIVFKEIKILFFKL